jgi:hypothetical protein
MFSEFIFVGDMIIIPPPVLPLDGLTPSAVFSVRKLKSSWTGPCMRVIRGGDLAQQDIYFDSSSGYVDIADLSSFIGGQSATVFRWYDQSGNNYIAQGRGSLPIVAVSGSIITDFGGKLTCSFASVSYFDIITSASTSVPLSDVIIPSEYTSFSVFKANVIPTTGIVYDGVGVWADKDGYAGHYIYDNKSAGYNWDSGLSFSEVSIATSTAYLAESRHDSGEMYHKVNAGTESNSPSGDTQVLTENVKIGAGFTTGSSRKLNGKISEIIVFPEVLTTIQRSALTTNINSFYTIF